MFLHVFAMKKAVRLLLLLTLFSLTGCISQTMTTSTKMLDLSNNPPPRTGAVYVKLEDRAVELKDFLEGSGYFTTSAPTRGDTPKFIIRAEHYSGAGKMGGLGIIPAFLLTALPIIGHNTENWEITLREAPTANRSYPKTIAKEEFQFRRTGYFSLWPYVYLFGKPTPLMQAAEGNKKIIANERTLMVNHTIYQASKNGLLDTNL